MRDNGVVVLDVRLVVETTDGETIGMHYHGYCHGPEDVVVRLTRGDEVDPSEYYFRAAPRFETASSRLDWLNHTVTVATGHRYPAGPVSFFGESSVGYIVSDPTTGAGAYLISSGENGSNTKTPGKMDAVSWLLSLLDVVDNTPIIKRMAGIFGEIIDGLGIYSDVMRCGLVYAIAKYVSGIFMTAGIAFFILPFLGIFISLYLAIMASFLIAYAVVPFFTARWSCKE